jgi:hypothetical protein
LLSPVLIIKKNAGKVNNGPGAAPVIFLLLPSNRLRRLKGGAACRPILAKFLSSGAIVDGEISENLTGGALF